MTKETIKISFNFRYGPDGTGYKKALTMNNNILEAWRDSLARDLATGKNKDYYETLYLSRPIESAKNVMFLNLTQAQHLIDWAKKINSLEMNQKRASYKANTCLIINN